MHLLMRRLQASCSILTSPSVFCVLSEMRGAYFDPNTNIRYDTNGADFEGKACLGGG